MPGHQILPSPLPRSAEVDLSTPRGCLLCLGLPRGLGTRGRGGHLPHLGQGSSGAQVSQGPRGHGLTGVLRGPEGGKKHCPATASWQADSIPQPRQLLCSSKERLYRPPPLSHSPPRLNVDNCRAPRQRLTPTKLPAIHFPDSLFKRHRLVY